MGRGDRKSLNLFVSSWSRRLSK